MPPRTIEHAPLVSRSSGWQRIGRWIGVGIGLAMLAYGAFVWTQPVQQNSDAVGFALMVTGLFVFVTYGPGWRRFLIIAAAIGGLGAAAVFAFLLYRQRLDQAGIAGAASVACGAVYWILTVNKRRLLATVRDQVADEWRIHVRANLIKGTVMLMLGIALAEFLLHGLQTPAGQLIDHTWLLPVAWVLVVGLVVNAALILLPLPFGLLGSLILKQQSAGLDDVAAQKVHGDAGYATATQIDAALRDEDHGGGHKPRFRD